MQDIDLNRLRIFKEVVVSGSFSRAAASLKQPKSRISRNIAALESELGVQLIYRTTRQFQLTPAGTELFQGAASLLNDLSETLDRVSSGATEIAGPLKITVPEDFGVEVMGGLCFEFMQLYPKVRIELHVSNQRMDLVKESIDVALRIGAPRDSTMIQKKLGTMRTALVMSPAFRARHSVTKLESLEALPFLAFSPSDPKRVQLKLANGKETRTLKLQPVFAANNFFPLRDLAMRGAGVAIVPPFLVREAVREEKLVFAFKDWVTEGVQVSLLIPHQRETPARVKKLTEFLAARLTDFL